jgi:hypothetical protein
MNDKIRDLQRQIEAEKRTIANCDHQWGGIFSNPETQREEYFTGQYETQGVHHWPITSYRDKVVPRWTRKCTLCGHEEHTYKQKPIITGYEADF